MKAEIKHDGMLMLQPETETEAYALARWWKYFNVSFKVEPPADNDHVVGLGITQRVIEFKDRP